MAIETSGGITLNLDYWDCECEVAFIHHISSDFCEVCEAWQDEAPSSRANEVDMYGHKVE